jgi:hypothetical protein
MLFDPKWTEGKELLDLNKPSLEALSHILRHKELWPERFTWNYSSCSQCAMGLAATLWKFMDPNNMGVEDGTYMMADIFEMEIRESADIFLGKGKWMPTYDNGIILDFHAVTPEMVADQIDKYLASQK